MNVYRFFRDDDRHGETAKRSGPGPGIAESGIRGEEIDGGLLLPSLELGEAILIHLDIEGPRIGLKMEFVGALLPNPSQVGKKSRLACAADNDTA